MKERKNSKNVYADLLDKVEILEDQVFFLKCRITEINVKLDTAKKQPSQEITTAAKYLIYKNTSNIIPFPGQPFPDTSNADAEWYENSAIVPINAKPGNLLPSGIYDYRPFLQRDGLILLAWDKRTGETGELYTAYWVTSTGVPRFYASRSYSADEFFMARPDRKSYAAEDGIDFYGQKGPEYLAHVAPELMMNNPQHSELRRAHIETLKKYGSSVNFDYKYLLTAERKQRLLHQKKPAGSTATRVG